METMCVFVGGLLIPIGSLPGRQQSLFSSETVCLRRPYEEVILMEKMLVVVFDSESKAYEGTNALAQLDREGSITVHALSVIKKNGEGKTVVLKTLDEFPIATLGGTAIGSLIGLLGGPFGLVVGATTGTLVGATSDLYSAGVSAEFVDDVSAILIPGTYAIVADISEEWVTPLDLKMEKLDGQVFRAARLDVEADQLRVEIMANEIETARLETEKKQAKEERKAKLQAKIDKLNKARKKKEEQAGQRLEQIKKEHERKAQAMKEKAANARGDAKAAIDARITDLNQHHQQAVAKWKSAQAAKLEKMSEKLDEKAKTLRS
jgi:uncharacterized membrane protein